MTLDLDFATTEAIIIVILSVLFSMSFHEAMHAYASNWLGDDTARLLGRLTLNPIKHIDPITTLALPVLLAIAGLPPFGAARPVPFNPYNLRYGEYGSAIVGVAGPLSNFVLAIVSALSVRFLVGFDAGLFTDFLIIFTFVNVGFGVFNMIPWPPLDGSRLLYAFAPEPLQQLMRRIEGFGFLGIIFFMFVVFQYVAPVVGRAIITIVELLLGLQII